MLFFQYSSKNKIICFYFYRNTNDIISNMMPVYFGLKNKLYTFTSYCKMILCTVQELKVFEKSLHFTKYGCFFMGIIFNMAQA